MHMHLEVAPEQTDNTAVICHTLIASYVLNETLNERPTQLKRKVPALWNIHDAFNLGYDRW